MVVVVLVCAGYALTDWSEQERQKGHVGLWTYMLDYDGHMLGVLDMLDMLENLLPFSLSHFPSSFPSLFIHVYIRID